MTTSTIQRNSIQLATRPVSVFASSSAFIGRSLRHSLRDGEGIVMSIVLPVFLMLLFTFVFGGAISGDEYITYVVPGVIILCVTQGASSTATAVSRDLSNGVMNRFRTLPIVAVTAVVGSIVASVVRNLTASVVVVGVSLLIGYRPSAPALSLIVAALFVAFAALTITVIMATLGVLSSSPENAAGYGFIFFILPYVSSGFVPTGTMPGWLQGFAESQPYTLVIETLRGLLDGTAVPASTWIGALIWCAGLIVVCWVVSAVVFPKRIVR